MLVSLLSMFALDFVVAAFADVTGASWQGREGRRWDGLCSSIADDDFTSLPTSHRSHVERVSGCKAM